MEEGVQGGALRERVEGRDWDGRNAVAESAAAASRGSASATAVQEGHGLLAAARGQSAQLASHKAVVDHGLAEAAHVPSAQHPWVDFPELPEAEAQKVKAALAGSGGIHGRSGANLDQGLAEAAHVQSAQHPCVDFPQRPEAEAQAMDHQPRGGRRGKGSLSVKRPMEDHADASLQPAAKARRAGMARATSWPHATAAIQPGAAQEGVDDDRFDEDPFGYIAEDIAAALPSRAAFRREGADGRGDNPAQGDSAELGHAAIATHDLGDGAAREKNEDRRGTGSSRRRQRGERRAAGEPEAKRARVPERGAGGHSAGVEEAESEEGGQPAAPAQRGAEGERRGEYGRRYLGLVADPVDTADAGGHLLRISGPLVYCDRCGRYAMRRLRRTLRNQCSGEAKGAYATRLVRMRTGCHPITGAELV